MHESLGKFEAHWLLQLALPCNNVTIGWSCVPGLCALACMNFSVAIWFVLNANFV